MIQLHNLELRPRFAQQLLRAPRVRAPALAEDHDGVLVDEGLRLGLCGRHAGGGAEEATDEERNFDGSKFLLCRFDKLDVVDFVCVVWIFGLFAVVRRVLFR